MRVRQAGVRLACTVAIVLMAGAGFAQSGEARIAGKVVDEEKKPLADVTVKAQLAGQARPLQTKTNKKGEWSINNLAGGAWEIEFSKDGFTTQRANVELKPDQHITGAELVLARPAPDPNIHLQAEWKRAVGLLQAGKIPEARKVYEDLLDKYPTVAQLHDGIARTYAVENQVDKAIEQSRLAVQKEPDNAVFKVLLGDLLMEKGEKAEAAALLDSVDLAKVEEPGSFINLMIVKINDKQVDEAIALADKLMARFPNEKSLYYYRGRAYVSANKLPEAKADLEKFVAAALPDARELPDARKILEQLKDVK
jgi:tetratricopeptide (TPR) repeat protein